MGDLALFLLALLLYGKAGEAYNIGNDQAITIEQLARKMLELDVDNKGIQFSLRTVGIKRYIPSIQKIKKLTGFTPKYKWDEAIKRTYLWFKN